jgi:hypothetical protein
MTTDVGGRERQALQALHPPAAQGTGELKPHADMPQARTPEADPDSVQHGELHPDHNALRISTNRRPTTSPNPLQLRPVEPGAVSDFRAGS